MIKNLPAGNSDTFVYIDIVSRGLLSEVIHYAEMIWPQDTNFISIQNMNEVRLEFVCHTYTVTKGTSQFRKRDSYFDRV